jgi:hypothetical protein
MQLLRRLISFQNLSHFFSPNILYWPLITAIFHPLRLIPLPEYDVQLILLMQKVHSRAIFRTTVSEKIFSNLFCQKLSFEKTFQSDGQRQWLLIWRIRNSLMNCHNCPADSEKAFFKANLLKLVSSSSQCF